MRCSHMLAIALLAAVPAGMVSAGLNVDEKGFVTLKLGEEDWKDYPGIPGIKYMVVEGDLKKPAPYVVRVKFSPGVMSMPHYHPEDRLATVLKGTWWTGKGESFDPNSTEPLPAGSFMKHPARAPHFDGAKNEEVILQLIDMGPSDTIFIKPELGPTGKSLE
ncbi:MAG TPA: cupin domain-containing protein [Burkholderiales bacterium]|nr:cupin domain-containing protein [Burkholderiales bacterium]